MTGYLPLQQCLLTCIPCSIADRQLTANSRRKRTSVFAPLARYMLFTLDGWCYIPIKQID